MAETDNTYKSPKDRRKKAPVKRVTLSAEAREKYEQELRERELREKTYGQHLHEQNKGKR